MSTSKRTAVGLVGKSATDQSHAHLRHLAHVTRLAQGLLLVVLDQIAVGIRFPDGQQAARLPYITEGTERPPLLIRGAARRKITGVVDPRFLAKEWALRLFWDGGWLQVSRPRRATSRRCCSGGWDGQQFEVLELDLRSGTRR